MPVINGTVSLNGGGIASVAVGGAVSWVAINGNYSEQNHLIITDFMSASFDSNYGGCDNVRIHYTTVYNGMNIGQPYALELDHVVHYPSPSTTYEKVSTLPSFLPFTPL
jgi:hypothetical protein